MALNKNTFQNVTNEAGIVWSRQRGNEAFSVAWVDFNNDDLLDLWISGHGYYNGVPINPTGKYPALYINQGDGTFNNIFEEDWRRDNGSDNHGTSWIDFDNDGDLDVWVAGGGELGQGSLGRPNLFFVNDNGTLTNQASSRNLEYSISRSRSSLWVDVDRDGLLDVINLSATRNDSQGNSAYFKQNSNGTFQAPLDLQIGDSRYAQLADLTGDGHLEIIVQGTFRYPLAVYDISDGTFNNITNDFNFPLTSEAPSTDLGDFGNRTSARDSIIADFDNDGDNDFFLTRSNIAISNDEPTVFKAGNKSIVADLLNFGRQIGFSFKTQGSIAIDVSDINEQDTSNLNASQIFIGASGRNPTRAELAAFSDTSSINSISFPINNTDRPSLVLNPNSSGVNGIKTNRSAKGIYIGYNPETETWQVQLSSPVAEILRTVVESTTEVTDVNTINFTNPNLADRALSDQLWTYDSDTGNFVNSTSGSGLGNPTLSQSAVAADFDNDKDIDIYIANSYLTINQPNILYDNNGDGTFSKVEMAGGAEGFRVGPTRLDFNYGSKLAVGDYDNDGFVDIFAGSTTLKTPRKTYLGTPSQLFQNQGNNNNWILIDLEGVESNKDGIGAQVKLTSGGVTQLREQNGGIHAFAQNDTRLHFGLADDEIIDTIEIRWASGNVQTINDVAVNQILKVEESDEPPSNPTPPVDPGTPDNISGTVDDDVLDGGGGNDTIKGLDGSDILNGDEDNDRLEGGNGNDTLRGGSGSDNLFGNEGDDFILGQSNNDRLFGQTGNDTLDGGEGKDIIRAGSGDNTIIGGTGFDTFKQSSNKRNITITNESLIASGTDTFSEIEVVNVRGGSRNQLIDGSDVTDLNVFLQGFGGNDTIIGGSRNDRIVGGEGEDSLIGGDGSDSFVYKESDRGNDTIADFESGEDSIKISASGFGGGLTPGSLSSEQFVLGCSSTDSDNRFLYCATDNQLSFDPDGSGNADPLVIATFSDLVDFQIGDILIVD